VDVTAWLSLAEAAAALHLSEKSVRRRLKSGELEGRRTSTRYGPAWQVRVDVTTDTSDLDAGATSTVDGTPDRERTDTSTLGTTGPELVRLVARQQDQLVQLAGRIGWLEAQLSTTQEQLRALQAPAETSTEATVHQSAQEGQQGASAAGVARDDLMRPPAAPRRAWWRFW